MGLAVAAEGHAAHNLISQRIDYRQHAETRNKTGSFLWFGQENARSVLVRRAGLFLWIAAFGLYGIPVCLSETSNRATLAKSGLISEVRQGEPAGQNVDWAAFLPAGEGQFQTGAYCVICHNLKNIVSDRRTDQSGWKDTVERMVYSNAAPVPEEEIEVISKYLAQYFGPDVPKLQLPVPVNSAPKEILLLLPGLKEEDVGKILTRRKTETISDLSKLEAVVGKGKADRIKTVISFSEGTDKED
jgi:hypothetical protein